MPELSPAGTVVIIAISVGREMSLLTVFEHDIGAPTAFRVVTGSGFDEAVAAEVAAQTVRRRLLEGVVLQSCVIDRPPSA